MSSLINPFTVMVSFALFLILLGYFKPQAARIVLGIFFLIMALAVNVPMALTQPHMFAEAGRSAYLPIYRWFFTVVIAWNPLLFVIPLILFEISTGLLILSQGRWAKLGLLFGSLFCLFLAPLGIESVTTPLLALAIALLLRTDCPRPVWKRALTGSRAG